MARHTASSVTAFPLEKNIIPLCTETPISCQSSLTSGGEGRWGDVVWCAGYMMCMYVHVCAVLCVICVVDAPLCARAGCVIGGGCCGVCMEVCRMVCVCNRVCMHEDTASRQQCND